MQGNKHQAGEVHKIPAAEIENLVTQELTAFLKNTDSIQEYIADFSVHKQKEILSKTQKMELPPVFIRALLAKVVLYKEKIEIILYKTQLIKGLESIITSDTLLDEAKPDTEEPIKITRDIRISTTSRNGGVLIVNGAENKEVNINPFLVKIIAKGHYWNKLIEKGVFDSAKEIADSEKEHNIDYIKKAIRLNILSPKIIESILIGRQPIDLTVEKLCSIKTLDWKEQERQLNLV